MDTIYFIRHKLDVFIRFLVNLFSAEPEEDINTVSYISGKINHDKLVRVFSPDMYDFRIHVVKNNINEFNQYIGKLIIGCSNPNQLTDSWFQNTVRETQLCKWFESSSGVYLYYGEEVLELIDLSLKLEEAAYNLKQSHPNLAKEIGKIEYVLANAKHALSALSVVSNSVEM